MDEQDVQGTSSNIMYNLVKFGSIFTIENYRKLYSRRKFTKYCKIEVLMPNNKSKICFDLILHTSFGNLSVYLRLESVLDDVITKFSYSVLDEGYKRMFSTDMYSKIFNINQQESEKINILDADSAKDYLFDNKLAIYIEGTVYEKIISPVATLNVSKQSVLKDFGHLFISEEFNDVTFSVGDTKIKAHKAILAARSSVFKAMFSHETNENTLNQVEVTDIQSDVLKDLLQFIYTGEAFTINTKADELLAAADKYELLELKSLCEDTLRKNITVENIVQNIILADLHGGEKLKEEAIKFIKKHGSEIMSTPEWKLMLTEYPKLVADVLHSYFT